jgi:hypothetical protein
MDEFQRIAAERFRHFLAERQPSLCQIQLTPTHCTHVASEAPVEWRLAEVQHPAHGQEVNPDVSARRVSHPSTACADHAALIQSP